MTDWSTVVGRAALFGMFLAVGLLAACASPEASRARSSGPGGDIGNRPARVEFHGRIDPNAGVPRVGLGVEKGGSAAPLVEPVSQPSPSTGR